MDTRADIERILDHAYAARQRQDLDQTVECFHENAAFKLNGSGACTTCRAEQRDALQGMFDTFELLNFSHTCRVIDPPRAVVHWRGTFRAKNTGREAEAEILDLFEIQDGRIVSLTSFFDTALAAQLTQPSA